MKKNEFLLDQLLDLHKLLEGMIENNAPNYQIKHAQEDLEFAHFLNDLYAPNNLIARYEDKELRKFDIEQTLANQSFVGANTALKMLAKKTVELNYYKFLYQVTKKSELYLLKKNLKRRKGEWNTKLDRITQKNIKQQVDIERLNETLKTLMATLKRPIAGSDYPKFKRMLLTKHPFQNYKTKARLTKSEKKLPNKMKLEIIKEKTSLEWEDSRLRDFFRQATNTAPTTKK